MDKDETLALAGEPVFAFRRRGQSDFCTCDERRYNELAQKPSLFEIRVFYTVDQLLAARKPLEEDRDMWMNDAKTYHATLQNREEAILELRQQLADCTFRNERLVANYAEVQNQLADQKAYYEQAMQDGGNRIKALNDQLAAAQAQEQQYREALEYYRNTATVETRQGLYESDAAYANEALAIPSDNSALQAMIAKAGEVMRERCAEKAELPVFAADAIHNLPPVTLEDLPK